MGRKKLTKGQKQHRREKKDEGFVFKAARDGFGNWKTMRGRLCLRIKPETKQLLETNAKARGISVADLLSQIAERHLRRNGGISRCTDNTKPKIKAYSGFQEAERTRNRPDNTEVVKINPLLTVTAKESIQLEAKATGLGQGRVVDEWVQNYSERMVASRPEDHSPRLRRGS